MSEPHWVVRAGMAYAQDLQDGYVEHLLVPGRFGLSVQYQPGLSVVDLALAGRFRNGKISFVAEDVLAAAMLQRGYTIDIAATIGRGYHHTLTLYEGGTGVMLEDLPDDLAAELETQFAQKIDNPALAP